MIQKNIKICEILLAICIAKKQQYKSQSDKKYYFMFYFQILKAQKYYLYPL